jgi:flagellar motor switch protein FliG
MSSSEVNDVNKAAILLMSLPPEAASDVMKYLSPKEVQQLGMAMAELNNVDKFTMNGVFSEFVQQAESKTRFGINNNEQVKELLVNTLGEEKASGILSKIIVDSTPKGLETLKWMDAKVVSEMILNEHPQIQSIILSHLDPQVAAEVFMEFDPKKRLDLMMRISTQEEIQPEAINELNHIIESQSSPGRMQKLPVGGLKVAADILNSVDKSIESDILDAIKQNNEQLANDLEDLMFIFDNLKKLDDRDFQTLLRELKTESLVLAMKGADDELQNMIYKNMSKRAGELLKDDFETLGPVKLVDVEAAQKEILSIAKQLAEAGTINLGNSGEEML